MFDDLPPELKQVFERRESARKANDRIALIILKIEAELVNPETKAIGLIVNEYNQHLADYKIKLKPYEKFPNSAKVGTGLYIHGGSELRSGRLQLVLQQDGTIRTTILGANEPDRSLPADTSFPSASFRVVLADFVRFLIT